MSDAQNTARGYVFQRVLAGIVALPMTGYALLLVPAMLRGKFDPLSATFCACTGTMAALCWWCALRGHLPESRRRMKFALIAGFALGAVGFAAGFFGPLVFAPGANQGPLLGIFFTGPLGFVLGTAAGWLLAHFRKAEAGDPASGRRAA